MKKSKLLLIPSLISILAFILASCKSLESKNNTPQTEPVTTGEAGQSQFMPFVSANGSTTDVEAQPGTYPFVQSPIAPIQSSQAQVTPLVSSDAPTVTIQPTLDPDTVEPSQTATLTPNETLTPTLPISTPNNSFDAPYIRPPGAHGEELPPERWQEWPALPVISDHAVAIYRAGITQGNDPMHFSKVGDCQNIHQYFLGLFDTPGTYRLGEKYAYLQETIDHFSGNWSRLSEAVRTGFNVASVLAPLLANPENCQPTETPLACEFRIWNPSFVIISMETWTSERPVQAYEGYLRQIVEYALSKNVMPIVATKADNLEGDQAINQIVARVAAYYDIPMWNFWAATNPLTDQGLMEDRFHLTNGPNYFDSPESLDLGWPVRNLTGLLTVDTVWKATR